MGIIHKINSRYRKRLARCTARVPSVSPSPTPSTSPKPLGVLPKSASSKSKRVRTVPIKSKVMKPKLKFERRFKLEKAATEAANEAKALHSQTKGAAQLAPEPAVPGPTAGPSTSSRSMTEAAAVYLPDHRNGVDDRRNARVMNKPATLPLPTFLPESERDNKASPEERPPRRRNRDRFSSRQTRRSNGIFLIQPRRLQLYQADGNNNAMSPNYDINVPLTAVINPNLNESSHYYSNEDD